MTIRYIILLSYSFLPMKTPAATRVIFSTDPATNFYNGFLVTKKNGDTLHGLIQLGSSKYGKNFVVIKQQDRTNPIEKAEIVSIRLYYQDSEDSSRRSTDFLPINYDKNVLWRLLGSGKAAVYDDELFPDTRRYYLGKSLGDLSAANIYNLIVVGKTGIVRVGTPALSWGVPKKRNHFLIKFINKRYKTNFSKKDFASNADMIKYIVDHG